MQRARLACGVNWQGEVEREVERTKVLGQDPSGHMYPFKTLRGWASQYDSETLSCYPTCRNLRAHVTCDHATRAISNHNVQLPLPDLLQCVEAPLRVLSQ
eukprot:3681266-Amphidinium_carterae.1